MKRYLVKPGDKNEYRVGSLVHHSRKPQVVQELGHQPNYCGNSGELEHELSAARRRP